jgi:hypothetical protein
MHFRLPTDTDSSRRRLWWFWFAVNLAMWSLISSKQRHYAVPWLTPLCLIAAEAAAKAVAAAGGRCGSASSEAAGSASDSAGGSGATDEKLPAPAWAVWGKRATIAIGVVAAAGILVAAPALPREGRSEAWIWCMAGIGAAAFLAGTLAGMRSRAPDGHLAFRSWWAGIVFAAILYAGTIERFEDRQDSPVKFCAMAMGALPPGCKLYDAGILRPVMLFYLGRNAVPVVPEAEIRAIEGPLAEKRSKRNRLMAAAASEILAREGPAACMLVSGNVLKLIEPALYGGQPLVKDDSIEISRGGAFLVRGCSRRTDR